MIYLLAGLGTSILKMHDFAPIFKSLEAFTQSAAHFLHVR